MIEKTFLIPWIDGYSWTNRRPPNKLLANQYGGAMVLAGNPPGLGEG
jgi:hypothetical protein